MVRLVCSPPTFSHSAFAARRDERVSSLATMHQIRPLPLIRKTKSLAVVLGFVAFTCAAVWLSHHFEADWIAELPALLAVPIGWFFFWKWRCPICAQRLQTKKVDLANSTKYSVYSRCDRCKIDWDTGIIGDARYDD